MLLLVTGSLCPWLTLLVLLQGHNSVGLLCVAVFGPRYRHRVSCQFWIGCWSREGFLSSPRFPVSFSLGVAMEGLPPCHSLTPQALPQECIWEKLFLSCLPNKGFISVQTYRCLVCARVRVRVRGVLPIHAPAIGFLLHQYLRGGMCMEIILTYYQGTGKVYSRELAGPVLLSTPRRPAWRQGHYRRARPIQLSAFSVCVCGVSGG